MKQKSPVPQRKILWIALAVVVIASIAGTIYIRLTRIDLNGTFYPKSAQTLDLSGVEDPDLEKLTEFPHLTQLNLLHTGISAETYTSIQSTLPNCEILWSVPFQGDYLASNTQEITLTSLSAQEATLLAKYFPDLNTIHADDCPDYMHLATLHRLLPQVNLHYTLPLCGQSWPVDATELTISDADIEELRQMLPYFSDLSGVTLEGDLPPAAQLLSLAQDWPDIRFYWQVSILGQTADVDTIELDISGTVLDDTAMLEDAIAYLPNLERVYMHDCGIADNQMAALNHRHPNVLFVWTVQVGQVRLSTDTTAFMPAHEGIILTDATSYNLRYCTEMVCLDLGHSWITQCEFVNYMPHLQYLIMVDLSLRDISPLEDHTELKYLELFLTDVGDYTPLLSCTGLEDLNISYTYGDVETICQMTWLKNLWWSPGQTWKLESLQTALPNTHLELSTHSSTGNGWRELENYYAQRDMLGMFYMYG